MNFEIPQEELRELQLDYLNSTRETVQLMKQHGKSLSSQKQFKTAFPVLLYLSHQLKGSGGSLGFPDITVLASRMSNELNQFLDDASPRPAPADLSRTVTAISAELDRVLDSAVEKIS